MAASYTPQPGHGPAPNMSATTKNPIPCKPPTHPTHRPPAVMRAANLPPKTTPTHVYFFGYQGPEPENCFQQWYPSPMHDPSSQPAAHFTTAEQYMMYHKALLMHDAATAAKIVAAATPAEAKTLGREVRNFAQDVWDAECDGIVEQGNWLKFSQHEGCRRALLATGERVLVEASPSDRVWGVGFAADEAEGREAEWGANKLGEALMRVRDRLRRHGHAS